MIARLHCTIISFNASNNAINRLSSRQWKYVWTKKATTLVSNTVLIF